MSTQSPFSPKLPPGAVPGLSGFEAEVVAVFADLVTLLGLPKSMGEIYGLIFASAEPPSFADIEQKLGLSKGSVSQGLRALRELGAIRDAEESAHQVPAKALKGDPEAPATRSTRWVATTELRQLLGTLLRERLTPYLERQDQRMQAAESALATESSLSPEARRTLQGRLKKLQTWQSRADMVLPLVRKML